MLLLQIIRCYNFNDETFIYSFFEFSVIYWILYEDVSLGIYVWLFEKKGVLFI